MFTSVDKDISSLPTGETTFADKDMFIHDWQEVTHTEQIMLQFHHDP